MLRQKMDRVHQLEDQPDRKAEESPASGREMTPRKT